MAAISPAFGAARAGIASGEPLAGWTLEPTSPPSPSSSENLAILDPTSFAVAVLFTWGLGLLPAWAARYWWKKQPLTPPLATLIAASSCLLFAITSVVVRSALGEQNPRVSLAWFLAFWVSRGIMLHQPKRKREEPADELPKTIADSKALDDQREPAKDTLLKLDAGSAQRFPIDRPAIAEILPGPPSRPNSLLQRIRHGNAAPGSTVDALAIDTPRRSPAFRWLFLLGGIALSLNVVLLASGYRVLVGQTVVSAGSRHVTNEWVYGSDESAVIVCTYWTGRSAKEVSWWYGPGRKEVDECPLLFERKVSN